MFIKLLKTAIIVLLGIGLLSGVCIGIDIYNYYIAWNAELIDASNRYEGIQIVLNNGSASTTKPSLFPGKYGFPDIWSCRANSLAIDLTGSTGTGYSIESDPAGVKDAARRTKNMKDLNKLFTDYLSTFSDTKFVTLGFGSIRDEPYPVDIDVFSKKFPGVHLIYFCD
jgi:hypothetical protein